MKELVVHQSNHVKLRLRTREHYFAPNPDDIRARRMTREFVDQLREAGGDIRPSTSNPLIGKVDSRNFAHDLRRMAKSGLRDIVKLVQSDTLDLLTE